MADLINEAISRKHPEFAEELRGANLAARHAQEMLARGELTQSEFSDFKAKLWSDIDEHLPMEVYASMRADGTYSDFEALRSSDGTRDWFGVESDRKATYSKVANNALDQEWLAQNIDSKRYAEESHRLNSSDEEIGNRIADEDFDGVASEVFASRHDTPIEQSNPIIEHFKQKYGDGDNPPMRIEGAARVLPPPEEYKGGE